MKKTTVSLGGINRNDYDGSAHIVNLRLKDKAFRPVPEPTKVDKEMDGKVEYIHASSDYRNLIDYKHYASVTEVYYRGNLNDNKKEQSIHIGSFKAKVLDVTHIGNTLIFLTDDGQYYFLFKNGEYKFLGNKIPEVKAKFKTRASSKVNNYASNSTEAERGSIRDSIYFHKTDYDIQGLDPYEATKNGLTTDVVTKISTDFEVQFNSAMKSIYNLGCIPNFPTQVRVALKLYDGTYVNHTAPIIITKGNGKESYAYCLVAFSRSNSYDFVLPLEEYTGTMPPYIVRARPDWDRGVAVPQLSLYDGFKSNELPEEDTPPEQYYGSKDNWKRFAVMADFIKNNREAYSEEQAQRPGADGTRTDSNGNTTREQSMLRVFKDSRFAIKVFVPFVALTVDSNLDDWKDIISSIDIFVSKPVNPLKVGAECQYPLDNRTQLFFDYNKGTSMYEAHRAYNFCALHKRLPQYSEEEMFDSVRENGNFYLIKSMDIADGEYKEIANGNWVSLAEDISKNMSVIEQERTLPDDYNSRDKMTSRASYVYNQSLHLADISSVLFKGFSPYDFCVNDGSSKYKNKGYCKVTIDGAIEKCVSFNLKETDTDCFISPMLYYPNAKASKIEIGVVNDRGVILSKTFPLAPHPSLNGAYYLDRELKPIVVSDYTAMPTEEVSATIVEPNKMIATSISNPFVFTAERTNYVGTGSILAMHAATTALSQGQSAQLPLYVFCTDGVYALTTNTQGEYMTSQNVTFDILADKKKLCATENAIVFGTQQGLKVIQGGTSALLSAPLNGSAHRYGKGEHYENPYLESFIPGMDMRDFNDFLCDRDTSVHYDYPNNEVWVFNPRSRYAYILSLYNNVWSMRSKDEADSIISAYPSLYLRNGNSLADVTPDNDSKLPFAIITNPIGGIEFTRIADITIDTRFITDNIRCTLLAGNNPFRLAKVRTLRAEKPQGGNPVPTPSLHLGRIPASVRYVQFAMDGHVTEANLTGFTMLTDTESYNPVR